MSNDIVINIIKDTNKKLYDPVNRPLSVSKCLELIKEEFNQLEVAQNTYKKNFDNPDSIYYQKTVDQIIGMWEAKAATSRFYGSSLDDYIGMVLTEDKKLPLWKLDHNFNDDKRLNGICTGFDQYIKVLTEKTNYRYMAREMTMYIKSNSGNMIRGRFDCLFYDPVNERYLIIDWKNTEKINDKNNYRKRMFGPCYHLDDCNLNEYTLQTHFYKKALCETYKLTTYDKVDCYICQMLPEAMQNGQHFLLHKQNFAFDTEFLDKVIDYCTLKNIEQQKLVNGKES